MIRKIRRKAVAAFLAAGMMLGACAQAEIIAADTEEEEEAAAYSAGAADTEWITEQAAPEGDVSLLVPESKTVTVEPVERVNRGDLVELITPEKTEEPEETEKPAGQEDSGNPVELITPEKTEEPEETEKPAGQEDPGDLVELITPEKTEEPEETEKPAGQESDGDLVEPIIPVKPEETEKPDAPEETEKPAGQETPGSQAELITPEKTEEPQETEKPAETEEPQQAEVVVQAPQLSSLTVRNVTVLKSPKSPETTQKGSITGTVGIEGSAKVTVTLTCKDPIVLRTKTCTASDPGFTFDELDAGEYTLTLYYEGIDGPVLTLTRVIKSEDDPQPDKKTIAITGVTPGENKIVIKGTADAKAELKAGTEPSSVELTVTSDSTGAFTATLVCSAKDYTAVWVPYGSDKTTRTKLEGKFVVTDEEMDKYPTFRRGDRYHPLIYRMQQRLADLAYYTIRVDGIYGSGTERAVRLFQQINGLKPTGIADGATQARLYSKDAKSYHDWIPGGTSYTLYRSNYYQAAVVPLQRRLRELGYYAGAADGYFGSATYRAVRNFQSRNGLVVTGAADPATQARLYSASAKPASSAPSGSPAGYRLLYWGCKGEAVLRLQRALLAAGYTQVRTADGIYGKWTYDAVRAFQRNHGLAVDGIAGRKTQNALYGTHY